MDYKTELNESQLQAVTYCEGPSMVIAGAGSGKTRVLTYKIAYLLEHRVEPWRILALTFTNKAAREMKERIASLAGSDARMLWMGTFHSIFSRILRAESQSVGFTPNFTIYDATDSKNLIKAIIKEMGLDDKTYKPSTVQARISNAKNRLMAPETYAASTETYKTDSQGKMPAIRDIYQRYWNRCRQSDAMDFDDLLLYTFRLFRDHESVRLKYAERFRYVLVDEYQDTNYAQHRIVGQLTHEHQRVCVVGDDAQSIYSFRGANIDNMLKFTETFPTARVFKLEQNYRSTQTIVAAANSLIEKNKGQIKKEVFSKKETGEPIRLFNAYSDVEEGEIVSNELSRLHRACKCQFSQIAILYRTNAQSRVFEEALRKRNIPYKIYGGLSFYQRKEVKDIIAYFRLAVNPHDEEAFKRVLNYPARGIGDTTLYKITAAANQAGLSLWTTIGDPEKTTLNVNKGTLAKLAGFRSLIDDFMTRADNTDAAELGRYIIQATGIMKEFLNDPSPESMSRRENVDELLSGLTDFVEGNKEEGNDHVSLADYLSEVSLLTDVDSDNKGGDDRVSLMTIHAAKGLEFQNVFIVGLEENLFPNQMSLESLRELEEERRLFYVALTRAEQRCFLSYASSRFRYGKIEFSNPSRFIREIDSRHLSTAQAIAKKPGTTIGRNPGTSNSHPSIIIH
ncbi:MAG: UvrD-helicase domain-containing protein, partial [Bacteroidales bacterium]|nr:UvrD-helicase domain-containing protein [Bacteroidales bacterium]